MQFWSLMCISKSFFVLFCTFLIFKISSNWKVYLEYWKLPQKSVTGSSAAKADLNEIQCNLFEGIKNEILSRDMGFLHPVYPFSSVVATSWSRARSIKVTPLLRSQGALMHKAHTKEKSVPWHCLTFSSPANWCFALYVHYQIFVHQATFFKPEFSPKFWSIEKQGSPIIQNPSVLSQYC